MMKLLIILIALILPWNGFGQIPPILQQAESLYRKGKVDECKKLVAQYVTRTENTQGYIAVGSMYARLKVWPDSVKYLQIAVGQDENNALAWYQLGLAQHQNKQIDDSVQSLRKSMLLSPKTAKYALALGEVLLLAQARYEARQIYTAALKVLPNEPLVQARLCLLNYQDAFYAQAIKMCQSAIKTNPVDTLVWTILAKAHYDSKDRKEALETFRNAIAMFPKASILRRARGLIYFDEKSYEQAILDLGKAFALDPWDDEAGLFLARSLYAIGNYADALPIYVLSIRLNRDYRFEFLSKQRDLSRKKLDEMADKYQTELEKL